MRRLAFVLATLLLGLSVPASADPEADCRDAFEQQSWERARPACEAAARRDPGGRAERALQVVYAELRKRYGMAVDRAIEDGDAQTARRLMASYADLPGSKRDLLREWERRVERLAPPRPRAVEPLPRAAPPSPRPAAPIPPEPAATATPRPRPTAVPSPRSIPTPAPSAPTRAASPAVPSPAAEPTEPPAIGLDEEAPPSGGGIPLAAFVWALVALLVGGWLTLFFRQRGDSRPGDLPGASPAGLDVVLLPGTNRIDPSGRTTPGFLAITETRVLHLPPIADAEGVASRARGAREIEERLVALAADVEGSLDLRWDAVREVRVGFRAGLEIVAEDGPRRFAIGSRDRRRVRDFLGPKGIVR